MTDRATTTASIVINNYNYGHFLKDAIESALAQSYRKVEVIVVDDGSTDNSCEIIAGYGDRVIPVLKQNGGQASSFNAGFASSQGDVVFFLDADDMLLGSAVETSVLLFLEPRTVKVHWPLWEVDRHGVKTGNMIPRGSLPEGDLRDLVIQDGPASHVSPPTSGNAWARSFLDRVFPMPELEFRLCADAYLLELAPLFGEVRMIPEPQGFYRIHGQNHYAGAGFEAFLREQLVLYGHILAVMNRFCRGMGLAVDFDAWKRNTWCFRLERAMQEIAAAVPPGETFILVDQDEWGMSEASRPSIPFLERHGKYWGNPQDDETAIRELERLRKSGASFIVFGWPAFWWFDCYPGLHQFLRSQFRSVVETDCVTIFDLRLAPSDHTPPFVAEQVPVLAKPGYGRVQGIIEGDIVSAGGEARIRLEFPSPPEGKTGWPWDEEISCLTDTPSNSGSWPRISVVTPCYNHAEFLEQTIRSVLLQRYPNLEYIVIDGGSSDGSVEIVKKYESHLAFWISEPDRGQGHAINKGFLRSTGQIMCWLNSDDYFLPGTLRTVAHYLGGDEGTAALVGHCLYVDPDGNSLRLDKGEFTSRRSLLRFWLGYNMPQSSIFWRREVFERVGLLDEDLYYTMDFDYWARIAEHLGFTNVDSILSCATSHPRAKTADDYASYNRELRTHCRRYWGSRLSLEYWRLAGSLFWHKFFTQGFEWRRLRVVEDNVSRVADGEAFILVDEENLAVEGAIGHRRRIPFLEHDGGYWGRPPDDETAIRELERLRDSGASFVIFAWPAFWWLEYYSGFHQHLTSRYQRILKNQRSIIFDLRVKGRAAARSAAERLGHG